MSPGSTSPPPERLEGARAENRETAGVAPGGEDLRIQPGRRSNVDAGQVTETLAHLRSVPYDKEGPLGHAIPSSAHLPSSRADVDPVLRPPEVVAHPEGLEEVDRLRGALDVLERVLHDDRHGDFAGEPVTPRADEEIGRAHV